MPPTDAAGSPVTQPSDDVLAAALSYAERGWAVFPIWWPYPAGGCACRRPTCNRPGKHPVGSLVPHGKDQATTDASAIRAWWRRCPRANVGIRTGAVSDLVVLDVDGDAGRASLHALVRAHGNLAPPGSAPAPAAGTATWPTRAHTSATRRASWVPGSTCEATAATSSLCGRPDGRR